MPWQFSMALDIGGRSEQQDCLDILHTDGRDTHLLVVADGMGGHESGALAARTVVETARREFNSSRNPDPGAFLGELCMDSHRAIRALGISEQRPPGSTCVFLYLNGQEAYWAHVGDSRLYHFHNGILVQQTEDHSVMQLMVAQGGQAGTITAGVSQNQLYMCLGGKRTPEPDSGASGVDADEFFMLCSDGFWTVVEPEEVVSALRAHPLEEDAAAYLVNLARNRGGASGDNISLVLCRWKPEQPQGLKGMLARWLGHLLPS